MGAEDVLTRGLAFVRGVQDALPAPSGTSAPVEITDHGSAVDPRPAPTVFVSWAHSHASWTAEQSSDWESQVAAFSASLRRLGIRAEVDLFHLEEPQDWTRFGPHEIVVAQFTLVVMSEAWAERWSGTNSPREGAGAAAEADTLKGLFSRDQSTWQQRVVVIMFPEVSPDVVPPDLQRVTRVSVNPSDPDSYDGLLRILTGQPRYPKPPVGEVPVLSAATGYDQPFDLPSLRKRLSVIERRKKQLKNRDSHAALAEREELDLSESATRGFIDAELTIDE